MYRPEIDGLRAIAVLSVIFYHAGFPWFRGGFAGVDIFFVISGYLIGSIILMGLANGNFTFVDFYERRVRRIFPALFLVLMTSSFVALLLFTPHQLRDFGQSLVATVSFVSNFYFSRKLGYFTADTENSALIHMWSLSVEEQFYLAFPSIVILLVRFRRVGIGIALVVLAILSLSWCLRPTASTAGGSFFATAERAWELLVGILVGVLQRRLGVAGQALPPALVRSGEAAGAVLMIAPLCIVSGSSNWPGVWTIPVVIGTGLLILLATPTTPLGRVLSLRPAVAIGLVSYSAYLWHQPLFAFARTQSVGRLSVTMNVALIAATFGLAWLSWRFVERPFRTKGLLGRRTVFALAIGGTAVFALLGLALHFADGLPQRYSTATQALGRSAQPSPYRTNCHTDGTKYRPPRNACRYFSGDDQWAVLGDSHGIELGYALAEDLRPARQGIVHLTFSGCQAALTYKSPNPGCSAWIREAVAWLEQQPKVTQVLLVFRPSLYLFGDPLKSYPQLPDEHPNFLPELSPEEARSAYWASYRKIIDRLVRSGKHVTVVRPVPALPVHVDHFIFGPGQGGEVTGTTRDWYRANNSWINGKIDTLADTPGISIVDPSEALCDVRRCRSILKDQALYIDDNHLSLAGARLVVRHAREERLLP